MSANSSKISVDSSDSSVGDLGNTITKSQDNPAKRWCFTLNNYSNDDVVTMNSWFSSNSSYIMAEEVGESGTPHLQGYIELKKKMRFTAIKKLNNCLHLEKSKGNRASNITYCMKGDGKKYGDLVPEVVFHYKPVKELEFLYTKMGEYNFPEGDRKLTVIVDHKGELGKTEFCRYCCLNLERCIVTEGKAADMKHQVVEYLKNTGKTPKYILMDVPRCGARSIDWAGVEAVKNMLFYSGKYEGGMIIGNKPCIVMFMNEDPDISKMSEDRWDIYKIKKGSKFIVRDKLPSV